jgi:acyl carrier protein
MTRDAIYHKLHTTLIEMFEVPADKIKPEARLYEDLDLDSIDAVDLVLKLQEFTGKKISAEQFQTVRSVADVVDKVHGLFAQAD